MTEQETIKVVTLIVMSYPAAERFKDENVIKAMVAVWRQVFKDDDPRLVELATQKHIATKKFPPNIAEIRGQMVLISHPEIIPPDQAWAAVADTIAAVGQYNDSDLNSQFPPLIARAVEIIGWCNLWDLHCSGARGGKPGLDRVAFIQQYTPMYERQRERAMLPMALSEAVNKIEKTLGGETGKMLDAARKKRIEENRIYNLIGERSKA